MSVFHSLLVAGVKVEILRGTDLRDQGYGGLWNVGKGAVKPPALVTLTFENPSASSSATTVAFVRFQILLTCSLSYCLSFAGRKGHRVRHRRLEYQGQARNGTDRYRTLAAHWGLIIETGAVVYIKLVQPLFTRSRALSIYL